MIRLLLLLILSLLFTINASSSGWSNDYPSFLDTWAHDQESRHQAEELWQSYLPPQATTTYQYADPSYGSNIPFGVPTDVPSLLDGPVSSLNLESGTIIMDPYPTIFEATPSLTIQPYPTESRQTPESFNIFNFDQITLSKPPPRWRPPPFPRIHIKGQQYPRDVSEAIQYLIKGEKVPYTIVYKGIKKAYETGAIENLDQVKKDILERYRRNKAIWGRTSSAGYFGRGGRRGRKHKVKSKSKEGSQSEVKESKDN